MPHPRATERQWMSRYLPQTRPIPSSSVAGARQISILVQHDVPANDNRTLELRKGSGCRGNTPWEYWRRVVYDRPDSTTVSVTGFRNSVHHLDGHGISDSTLHESRNELWVQKTLKCSRTKHQTPKCSRTRIFHWIIRPEGEQDTNVRTLTSQKLRVTRCDRKSQPAAIPHTQKGKGKPSSYAKKRVGYGTWRYQSE